MIPVLKRAFTALSPPLPRVLTGSHSLKFSLKNTPGSLLEALQAFESYAVNLTHIESKPADLLDDSKGFVFEVTVAESCSELQLASVMTELEQMGMTPSIISPRNAPWFPKTLLDLDLLDKALLNAGAELESDHPGFNDPAYRERRQKIAEIAVNYKLSHGAVPRVQYSEEELETWRQVYLQLHPLLEKHACVEYLDALNTLRTECRFTEDSIPQLEEINQCLRAKTGFRLMPVAGLLSGRDFLAALAFRVFPSTQYIRHSSAPLYTPEPDIVHELIGHAPLFANPAFADFSQQLGLASLGASDEEVTRLCTCYWYSVEFGIILDAKDQRKAYGAGVLSSISELKNAVDKTSQIRPFRPKAACNVPYPITTLQPVYWYSRTFEEAKQQMWEYARLVPNAVPLAWDRALASVKVFQELSA